MPLCHHRGRQPLLSQNSELPCKTPMLGTVIRGRGPGEEEATEHAYACMCEDVLAITCQRADEQVPTIIPVFSLPMCTIDRFPMRADAVPEDTTEQHAFNEKLALRDQTTTAILDVTPSSKSPQIHLYMSPLATAHQHPTLVDTSQRKGRGEPLPGREKQTTETQKAGVTRKHWISV